MTAQWVAATRGESLRQLSSVASPALPCSSCGHAAGALVGPLEVAIGLEHQPRGSRSRVFSCKGRGFRPSCLGRRMCATAANLMERVLPEVDLRQWVLTFPFAWRRRLGQDGALLGTLTRLFVQTAQLRLKLELLNDVHRQATQTLGTRLRFLELAAESASKVTALLYTTRDRIGEVEHAFKTYDREALGLRLNAVQQARVVATIAAAFRPPEPELDNASTRR